jgi:hypothetical protein
VPGVGMTGSGIAVAVGGGGGGGIDDAGVDEGLGCCVALVSLATAPEAPPGLTPMGKESAGRRFS